MFRTAGMEKVSLSKSNLRSYSHNIVFASQPARSHVVKRGPCSNGRLFGLRLIFALCPLPFTYPRDSRLPYST